MTGAAEVGAAEDESAVRALWVEGADRDLGSPPLKQVRTTISSGGVAKDEHHLRVRLSRRGRAQALPGRPPMHDLVDRHGAHGDSNGNAHILSTS